MVYIVIFKKSRLGFDCKYSRATKEMGCTGLTVPYDNVRTLMGKEWSPEIWKGDI